MAFKCGGTLNEDRRVIYTSVQRPSPAQMSPKYTQSGRQWIPLNGPHRGKARR